MRCLAQEMRCISAEEALSFKPGYTLHSTLPSFTSKRIPAVPMLTCSFDVGCVRLREGLNGHSCGL